MLNKIEKGMSNAAEAINENFEKLDSEVVEWTEVTLEDNFEAYDSGGGLYFKKFGDVVMLSGEITNKTSIVTGNSIKIGRLPEEVAPFRRVTSLQPGSDKMYFNLQIYPNGDVQIGRYNAGTGSSGASDIPKGAWLNLYETYLI